MRQEDKKTFQSPLIDRYASEEMAYLFSAENKFRTWRKLWVALAEGQRELGLPISEVQIDELKQFQDKIDYEEVARLEKETRHDVMAHIGAFGQLCPKAKPIIHLGATSAYVVDNTDLILIKEGLRLILQRLVNVLKALRDFAYDQRNVAILGFTHLQPAQPTTLGKRATLWLYDLITDLHDLEFRLEHLAFLGVKGTTGTQESFLKLFQNDQAKVVKLDGLVSQKFGFNRTFPVTGQIYSRKVDYQILSLLSGLAQSAHKFSNDLRILQHLKEVEEPFETTQVGSSAMAYKRNPMRCERMAALARYVICLSPNAAFTAAGQFLERTLDDSANRRLTIPEAFLATEAILKIYHNVASGLVVNKEIINYHLQQEVPFLATEELLMEAVRAGGDRQELHERIRKHAMEAAAQVKRGGRNDLFNRLGADPLFTSVKDKFDAFLSADHYIGRAPQQVEEFLKNEVETLLIRYGYLLGLEAQLEV
ncbi:MAG: adenylosuccinate lyase [Candidatus Tectomicrobia bacterium]|uniref:Adenylosuccinate lyase n=1 Tax=Tectimicrobiota bacterium TaxID=2528274 RepID=A0A933GLA1_UNCTE|nr:adenylosuccinate lyase [Candidatus Tectomicrobia bacterium]